MNRRSGGRGPESSGSDGQEPDVHQPEGIRLQKVLAGAGVGSRRACEDVITAGRVTVDGQVVRQLGVRIDPATAVVHVDGMRLALDDSLVTLALNKPLGVYSTMADERGRPDLSTFVSDRSERLFHVGRLDADTSGLLLLTNDGELAHRLAHPSHEVLKTYVATVRGTVPRTMAGRLREGVPLEDGLVRADAFTVMETTQDASLVQIVLHEGRHHIVRRLLAHVGHPVTELTRTQVGPIRLGRLRPGQTRVIQGKELGRLMSAVGL